MTKEQFKSKEQHQSFPPKDTRIQHTDAHNIATECGPTGHRGFQSLMRVMPFIFNRVEEEIKKDRDEAIERSGDRYDPLST